MRPIFKLLGLVGLCVISGVVGGALTRTFGRSSLTISYVDFISIVLTALAVLITTLGVFIGVLAVVGWRSIEDKLQEHSYRFIANQLQEGGPLLAMIQRTVQDVVYAGISPVDEEEQFETEGGNSEGTPAG